MSTEGVIAVVIGRAGSRGLPGKNALLLHGRPMICYAIDHARAAETVDRVVVSTDGDAIAAAATAMDVPVVRRPSALATDTAPVVAAVRHALIELGAEEEVVVVLYANVPLRPPGLVDRAVRTLAGTGADSVQSYTAVGKHHPWWMVSLDEAGRVRPLHEGAVDRRQDLPHLWLPDGGVIAARRGLVLETDPAHPHAFLGTDRRGIESPAGSVVDVDGPLDLGVAEALLTRPVPEVTA